MSIKVEMKTLKPIGATTSGDANLWQPASHRREHVICLSTRSRPHPDHRPPARRSFAASFWAPGLFHRSAVWLDDLNIGLTSSQNRGAPRPQEEAGS